MGEWLVSSQALIQVFIISLLQHNQRLSPGFPATSLPHLPLSSNLSLSQQLAEWPFVKMQIWPLFLQGLPMAYSVHVKLLGLLCEFLHDLALVYLSCLMEYLAAFIASFLAMLLYGLVQTRVSYFSPPPPNQPSSLWFHPLDEYTYPSVFLAAPGLSCSTRDLLSCSMQTFSCGMWGLVPWPGIKPRPLVLGTWSLSQWTTREVPTYPHVG